MDEHIHSMADGIYPDDGKRWQSDEDDINAKDKSKLFKMSRRKEEKAGSFRCAHCATVVPITPEMGTSHRNHCNTCLWSKHVDKNTSGDRASDCHAGMKPIGLTLKHEGKDKYTGEDKLGDVMLIHECAGCGDFNINRVAADDNTTEIMNVFERSAGLPSDLRHAVAASGIELYGQDKRDLIERRLFGIQE